MFKVGLENNVEGRSQAWVLGHPGCFAYGENGTAALRNVPAAIQEYRGWINRHTPDGWISDGDLEFELDDIWECYFVDEHYNLTDDGYEVNAWFRHDWLPLSAEDVQRGLLLLHWGREELLSTVQDLDTETLERTYPNERWSISGILNHIGGAEWWYLSRLGLAFAREDVPEQPFARLCTVRDRLIEVLPSLIESKQVVGLSGEFWSPRKLLRRAAWHERDHTAHIRKLL